jgi:hypothetical protein
MSMYEALATLGPPKGLEMLDAVMRDVWTPEQTRYAGFALRGRPWPTVCVARVQGEVYHWAQEPCPALAGGRDGRSLVLEVDAALSRALALLPSMTVSDALQAGERRRCQRMEHA